MIFRPRESPLFAAVLAALLLFTGPACAGAEAQPQAKAQYGSQTHLPLPRLASLKATRCNLRSGPGLRYPITWVYRREHLPVVILREFGNWRLLRLPDGTRGWMHRVLISGRRTFVVTAQHAVLRRAPKDKAAAVARLRRGVLGRLRRCRPRDAWCAVSTQGYSGYVRRTQIWGSDADARKAALR